MRITKQPSGGRGEYEIADRAGRLTPSDLVNRALTLRVTDLEFPTGVELGTQGGKRRLRRQPGVEMQVPRQLAAVLMLPKPVRDEQRMEGGRPVLQTDRYIIDDIELEDVERVRGNAFRATARIVNYSNQAYQAEQLNVASRFADVKRVWSQSARLPDEIRELVNRHRELVNAGAAIPEEAERVVRDLQRGLSSRAPDIGIAYAAETDVLPGLLDALGQPIQNYLVDDPQEIDVEQTEIRRREIVRWRQQVARRGPASVRFRRDVRRAYRDTCIVCGLKLPSTVVNQNPGIDAAHILPWAKYDLDVVSNGVAVCKLHHWAFDESLIVVEYSDGAYSLAANPRLATMDPNTFTIDFIQPYLGPIDESRLPRIKQNRPRPEYLAELRTLLEGE